MIGDLFVRDISSLDARHVAARAVRLVRMMFADEGLAAVAGQTAGAGIGDPFRGSRRSMGIMAGGAGKTVAALALALAFEKRFPLAGRPAVRANLTGMN